MRAATRGSAGTIVRAPPNYPPFYPRWEDFTPHTNSTKMGWNAESLYCIETHAQLKTTKEVNDGKATWKR
jgi:hypothetical protein